MPNRARIGIRNCLKSRRSDEAIFLENLTLSSPFRDALFSGVGRILKGGSRLLIDRILSL